MVESVFEIVNENLRNKRQYSLSKTYSGIFAPTGASVVIDGKVYGKCARAYFYELNGIAKTEIDDKGAWIFEMGENFESSFIELAKRAGIFEADHIRFAYPFGNGYQVSGEIDLIVRINGEPQVMELKSSYGQSFIKQHIAGYKRSSSNMLTYTEDPFIPAPKIDNLLQTMNYLYYLSVVYPKVTGYDGIDTARIAYLARDNGLFSEYTLKLEERGNEHYPIVKVLRKYDGKYEADEVKLKPFTVQDMLRRYIYVGKCVEKNELPDREYNPEYSDEQVQDMYDNGELSKSKYEKYMKCELKARDWRCDYCPFLDYCLRDGG